jgi:hypothetical protein
MTNMTIIINITEVFWSIIALFGVVLASSGFFAALRGLTNFGTITLANAAALSNISGGIAMSVLGLVVVYAGYLGIRGKIIFVRS